VINDFYSKLSDQEKKIFYVAAAFVVLMMVDRAFLGPMLSKMKSLDGEIAQQKNIIQRDLRFLSYKDRILEENESLKVYYGNDTKTVEEIIAVFLRNLESMATESKINLIKVAPTDSKQKKGYVEYYASLECEGFLENLVSFMHAIDTSNDLLKIIKTDMTLKRASGEEVLCNMVVAKIIIGSDKDFDSIEKELRQAESLTSGGSKASNGKKRSSGSGAGSSSGSGGSSDGGAGGSSGSDAGSSGGGAGGSSGSDAESSGGSGGSSGGGAGGSDQDSVETDSEDTEMNVQNSRASSVQDEKVSQRIQMKGFAPKKGEKISEKDSEKPEPIRKSVFEKIMKRVERETKTK